jgi:DNA oxidative demethylase
MTPTTKRILNSEIPSGLFYVREVISIDEEAKLLERLEELPFEAYVFGQYLAKRTVVQFGGQEYRATYGGNQPMENLPEWLRLLRSRCSKLLTLREDELAQILVARYENAGIGWHRDAPQFGPTVVGISLCGPGVMRFRKVLKSEEDRYRIELAPRSLYVISGDARSAWQHSMAPVQNLRYSITFRTISAVKNDRTFGLAERAIDPRHQPAQIERCLSEQFPSIRVSHQRQEQSIKIGDDRRSVQMKIEFDRQ